MARLGLTNIVYLGEGRYEQDSSRLRQYLVPITADDCLALLKRPPLQTEESPP
jgi:hypothetical protein